MASFGPGPYHQQARFSAIIVVLSHAGEHRGGLPCVSPESAEVEMTAADIVGR